MIEDEQLRAYIKNDPEQFESTLLSTYLYHRDTIGMVETAVGKDHDGNPVADFENPIHEGLFWAIRRYHELTGYGVYSAPAFAAIQQSLVEVSEKQHLLIEAQIVPAMNKLLTYCNSYVTAPDYHNHMTKNGFYLWLEERRLTTMLAKLRSERWSTVRFSEEWTRAQTHVRALAGNLGEEKLWHSPIDCINVQPVDVFIDTPWKVLNERIGGGMARGDGVLIIGSTGTGKTAIACQLAGYMAKERRAKVVVVSTEQSGPGVMPRVVSSLGHIPYKLMTATRSVQPDKLGNYRQEALDVIQKLTDAHFYFRDWKPGDNIHTGITSIVDYYCSNISPDGTIDCLILDWLGGKITHGMGKDDARSALQQAADEVALLADDLNIVTVATAQANPLQAANKKQVGGTDLAECKTLHRYFEHVWGISGLIEGAADADNNEVHAKFADDQFWNIDKSRFGTGGLVAVRRNFAYQKLEDRYK